MRTYIFLVFMAVLVLSLSSCSRSTQPLAAAAPAAASTPQPSPSPMSGAQLFAAYCASCHGEDGHGDGPAAPALKSKLPDLATMAKRKGGKFPEGDTYQVIKWGGGIIGHGSKDMPVWGVAFRTLTPNDEADVNLRIKTLISYLESIQEK